MKKETYIYFNEGAGGDALGDDVTYPSSSFTGIDASSTTALNISFKALTGNAADDEIALSGFTAGYHKEVCEALAIAMNTNNGGFVVFADQDNGVYHKELTRYTDGNGVSGYSTPTAVTITLDS